MRRRPLCRQVSEGPGAAGRAWQDRGVTARRGGTRGPSSVSLRLCSELVRLVSFFVP